MDANVLNYNINNNLAQLRASTPEELYERVLALAQSCEAKKQEMHEMNTTLLNDKKKAVELDKEYKQTKLKWTAVKCIMLAAGGGLAIFIPGVGWTVSGMILAGNAAAIYGDHRNDKNNQQKINKIIQEVNAKSQNSILFAQMVNDKKADFDRARLQLIEQGIDDKHACVILILDMLMGIQPPHIINIGVEQGSTHFAPFGFPLIFTREGQERIADYASWAYREIFGGVQITPDLVRNCCAGAAVFGIALNVYMYAQTCLKTNEAVERIEQLREILDEGQHSLQFFITLLNYIRENMLKQTISRNKEEVDLRITEIGRNSESNIIALNRDLERQSNMFATHLGLVQSQLDAQADIIRQLKDEIHDLKRNNQVSILQGNINDLNRREQMSDIRIDIDHLKSMVNVDQNLAVLRDRMEEQSRNTNQTLLILASSIQNMTQAFNNRFDSLTIIDPSVKALTNEPGNSAEGDLTEINHIEY